MRLVIWFAAKTHGPSEAQIGAALDSYLSAHPDALAAQSAEPAAEPLGESEVAAIRDIIREHLISNPEIIRDAINELQRKELEAEAAAQTAAISNDKDRIFASARQAVLGNPEGEVTLVEFFDYNCGYCKRAHCRHETADRGRLEPAGRSQGIPGPR